MCNNYCIRCACKVPVFFGHRRVLIEHGSIKTTVDEEYAICQYCGEKVYDPKVHDRNVKARERAMDEALKEQLKGEKIMKVSEICKIVNDCDRLRDILQQNNHTLTDSEKQEIGYLLWDYRDELLKKEVK